MNAISKVAKMILALVPPVAGAALIAAPCHAMAPAADDASPDNVAIRPFRPGALGCGAGQLATGA